MPTGFADIVTRNIEQLRLILPELVAILGFLVALVTDLIVPADRRRTTGYVALLSIIVAMSLSVLDMRDMVQRSNMPYKRAMVSVESADGTQSVGRTLPSDPPTAQRNTIFSGMMARDSYGVFFKFVLLLGTAISLLVAMHARDLEGPPQGEFFLLLLATCIGGMFLAQATNLLLIYLALETLSIVSYAMAGFTRADRKSAEAGMKYVIYGAMASGIMIFGMSYLYGLSGSLDLGEVAATFRRLEANPDTLAMRGALAALVAMIFVGLLYKIAAAPFHYWSPDVYEGAPTSATAFFSVVPKAAGFAVLVRVIAEFFPLGDLTDAGFNSTHMEKIFGALAILTMTIGNFAALGQSNAKRMLAYSSIAHAGYMLAGLSVLQTNAQGTAGGPAAVLYYLVVYLFMNLGAFLCLIAMENLRGSCELDQLKGAIRREPIMGAALVIFLFSLTGLPPLAGFTGKYLIMVELARAQNWFMILFLGLNSVISLYYYMRLAKVVAIDEPKATVATTEDNPFIYRLMAGLHVIALIVLFVYFEPVMVLCQQVIFPLIHT